MTVLTQMIESSASAISTHTSSATALTSQRGNSGPTAVLPVELAVVTAVPVARLLHTFVFPTSNHFTAMHGHQLSLPVVHPWSITQWRPSLASLPVGVTAFPSVPSSITESESDIALNEATRSLSISSRSTKPDNAEMDRINRSLLAAEIRLPVSIGLGDLLARFLTNHHYFVNRYHHWMYVVNNCH
jgi:hypothetical protein